MNSTSSSKGRVATSSIEANSCKTARLAAPNLLKIVLGTGVLDPAAAGQFLESIKYNELAQSTVNTIQDMDQVADFIFER